MCEIFSIQYEWKKLAVSVRNFLEGINNDAFTDNDDGICKDQWKERVRDDIVDVIYNDPNDDLFQSMGKDSVKGNILTLGMGVMYPIYQAFSIFAENIIKFEKLIDLTHCDIKHIQKKFICGNYKKTKFSKNVLKTTITQNTSDHPIIIINCKFPSGDDLTRVVELHRFTNKNGIKYNLSSISSGEGIHYHIRIKCNGNWGWYNDSGGKGRPDRPTTKTGTSSDARNIGTFKYADEITAIYVRNDLNSKKIENIEVNDKLYNKIINPKTGRYVNINGKIGREILSGFINQSKK